MQTNRRLHKIFEHLDSWSQKMIVQKNICQNFSGDSAQKFNTKSCETSLYFDSDLWFEHLMIAIDYFLLSTIHQFITECTFLCNFNRENFPNALYCDVSGVRKFSFLKLISIRIITVPYPLNIEISNGSDQESMMR